MKENGNTDSKIDTSGFKLLAIRPLKDCDARFRKNLKEGVVYKFYQDYKFLDKNGDEILEKNDNLSEPIVHIEPPSRTLNLYSQGDLKINVSAVVGENGSGKSSLIDFFNVCIYCITGFDFKTIETTKLAEIYKVSALSHFTLEYLNAILPYFRSDLINNRDKELIQIKVSELNEDKLIGTTGEILDLLDYLNKISFTNNFTRNIEPTPKIDKILNRYLFESSNYTNHFNFPTLNTRNEKFTFLNLELRNRLEQLLQNYNEEAKFEENIRLKLNFELIFLSKDGEIERCKRENDKFYHTANSEKLFYSILLNFSTFSLLSSEQGMWLEKLFHKNDGYQTPLVLNPLRKDGIIDPIHEMKLAIDRLTYNVIDQIIKTKKATFLGKYEFGKFILNKNHNTAFPIKEVEINIANKDEFLSYVSDPPFPTVVPKPIGILDFCLDYLFSKFKKISRIYPEHLFEKPKLDSGDLAEKVDKLETWQINSAKQLFKEKTHITNKFERTYNFLKDYEELKTSLPFLKDWNIDHEIEIDIAQLEVWIEAIKAKQEGDELTTDEFLSHFFPNIFSVDFEFINEKKEPIRLSKMSSGEKQNLLNLSTVSYHILNIDSVAKVSDLTRQYDSVNIIFDEIELHYHPNYQKEFVRDAIEMLKSLNLKRVKNYNVLFLTHSPFILSDIPSNNILRLENGEPSKEDFGETFGANIHDLLANDFFLKDGFMGEFAKKKIKSLIIFLSNEDSASQEKNFETFDNEKSLALIDSIGEPLLRNSLLELHRTKFGLPSYESLLEKYIKDQKPNS